MSPSPPSSPDERGPLPSGSPLFSQKSHTQDPQQERSNQNLGDKNNGSKEKSSFGETARSLFHPSTESRHSWDLDGLVDKFEQKVGLRDDYHKNKDAGSTSISTNKQSQPQNQVQTQHNQQQKHFNQGPNQRKPPNLFTGHKSNYGRNNVRPVPHQEPAKQPQNNSQQMKPHQHQHQNQHRHQHQNQHLHQHQNRHQNQQRFNNKRDMLKDVFNHDREQLFKSVGGEFGRPSQNNKNFTSASSSSSSNIKPVAFGTPISVSKRPPPSMPDGPMPPNFNNRSPSKLVENMSSPYKNSTASPRRFGTPGRDSNEMISSEQAEKELKNLVNGLIESEGTDSNEPPPEQLDATLLKHQTAGLNWMKNREAGKKRGGILADDMGLGKTIQSISLILANKPSKKELESEPPIKTTLIVAPLNLLHQWDTEIKAKTKPGSLTTFIYHNSNPLKKNMTFNKLKCYDVILVTYETLASEYERLSKEAKTGVEALHDEIEQEAPSKTKKSTSKPERTKKVDVSKGKEKNVRRNVISDSENDSDSEKDENNNNNSSMSKGKKKKVVSDSTESESDVQVLSDSSSDSHSESDSDSDSESESEDDSDNDIPSPRRKSATKNKKQTTKKVILKPKKNVPLLYSLTYYRIILDEAHRIKSRDTKSAKACCQVDAKYRWCLTGTPIQNTVEDLYSLFRFLGKEVAGPFNELSEFKEKISGPIKRGNGNVAIKRLHIVLKSILLRRTKTHKIDGKPLLQLPPRNVEEISIPFRDPDEQIFYTGVENRVQVQMNRYVKNGDQTKYFQALVLLLRLRQACCHPELVTKGADKDAVDLKEQKKPVNDPSELDFDDLAAQFEGLGVNNRDGENCVVCQRFVPRSEIKPIQDVNSVFCERCRDECTVGMNVESSTKVHKILEILETIKKSESGGKKTIIFSQFVTFFKILEPFLKRNGYKFVRYDGAMSVPERNESLEKIRSDPRTTIILISLKCGSVGLNLTSCSNVILSDLWWNPAIEEQAIDRVHRIGQRHAVNVFKIMISNTVEDRILKLQMRKAEIAQAALEGGKLDAKKLTMQDIMFLFRGEGLPNQ